MPTIYLTLFRPVFLYLLSKINKNKKLNHTFGDILKKDKFYSFKIIKLLKDPMTKLVAYIMLVTLLTTSSSLRLSSHYE